MNKFFKKIYQSRVLLAVLLFGLGGAIWGGFLYAGQHSGYPLTAVGGLILAIFGGLGLSLYAGSPKRILTVLGLGFVGVVVGFGIAGLGIYPLLIWGTNIFAVFPSILVDLIKVEPNLKVGAYWLNFAIAGGFIGLFFALGLRKKILPMVLRGAIGFGLAAIIGPIIGNAIGNLFNALLLNYILTFIIICVIFSVFLTVGMRKT
ncbi:MAG: hypothetical protein WAP23_01045 [Candidatus Spechtbacterales bacterium]